MTAKLKHPNLTCLPNTAVQPKSPVQPFLKWAGGKRQLLATIRPFIPQKFNCYFEPFIGGGAVFFDLQPAKAVINDANAELINLYKIIRDAPDKLLAEVAKHENTKDYFYRLREQDRDALTYNRLGPIARAARILYLNKTCFNGLFRVNSQGYFNVPFGKYPNPNIAPRETIHAVSIYLNNPKITIKQGDFGAAVESARAGDFIYFDPPYDPLSDTSSFTGYHHDAFGKDAQARLAALFKELDQRGCKVMLSNSNTAFIRQLYEGYRVEEILATRRINAVGSGRGAISEVLVMNYGG